MERLAFLFLLLFSLDLQASLLSAQDVGNDQSNVLDTKRPNHADIVLIGAVGDLAKKYLWKGLFDLFRVYSKGENGWTFSFTGAGRKNYSTTWPQLNATIHEVVICDKSQSDCLKDKASFISRVSYVQLKTDLHYETLCANHLQEISTGQNVCYKDEQCEYQRIFYLSVPPFTYKSIAESIASHCHPMDQGSLKVVLEKPFGHDEPSSISMAESLSQTLNDNEVYRVDHYLGKQAVGQIINFRLANEQVESMLNKNFVERIEIVMKETVGVKGRTAFYDQYGVMCDVMQNHLTEILSLLTMDLPTNQGTSLTDSLMKERLRLLKQIISIQASDVLLGQYQGYADEVREEIASNATSKTPTFAAVKLLINSDRWRNVPIILMAGKQMDERVGYARVIFKETEMSPNSEKSCATRKQISFHIGHGKLKTPAIVASKSLLGDSYVVPYQWKQAYDLSTREYLHTDLACFEVLVPEVVRDAYSMLIEQLFLGRKENFVTTDSLLESWRVWGNINAIQASKEIVIYPGGKQNTHILDFTFNNRGLFFSNVNEISPENTLETVLGHTAYIGTHSTISALLGQAIKSVARQKATQGDNFHIAFSGGSSPLPLFRYLVQSELHTNSWKKVHVWQVDERCSLDSSLSNFKSLCKNLINLIPELEYENVHPMMTPTFPHELCWEKSAESYEQTMKQVMGPEPVFDFIVLGVGADGHTASLFPYNSELDETDRYATLTDNVGITPPKRMSLTYRALTEAKNIAAIVSGASKRSIMQSLITTHCADRKLHPICKVLDTTSEFTWYITDDALPT